MKAPPAPHKNGGASPVRYWTTAAQAAPPNMVNTIA